jgi:flagellar biosynthesis anti-sigma factor FlgM
MRIDPNQGGQPLAESSRNSSQSTANAETARAASASSGLGEDQAQLSGAHMQAQVLTVQALQFPEIRQEKVNALRQVVGSGSYHPGANQVADAIFAHLAQPAA